MVYIFITLITFILPFLVPNSIISISVIFFLLLYLFPIFFKSSARVDPLQVFASLLLFLDPSMKPYLIHATTSLFSNVLSNLLSSCLFCPFAFLIHSIACPCQLCQGRFHVKILLLFVKLLFFSLLLLLNINLPSRFHLSAAFISSSPSYSLFLSPVPLPLLHLHLPCFYNHLWII